MLKLFDEPIQFDGKATTLLSETRARHGGNPSNVSDLVGFVGNNEGNVSEAKGPVPEGVVNECAAAVGVSMSDRCNSL